MVNRSSQRVVHECRGRASLGRSPGQGPAGRVFGAGGPTDKQESTPDARGRADRKAASAGLPEDPGVSGVSPQRIPLRRVQDIVGVDPPHRHPRASAIVRSRPMLSAARVACILNHITREPGAPCQGMQHVDEDGTRRPRGAAGRSRSGGPGRGEGEPGHVAVAANAPEAAPGIGQRGTDPSRCGRVASLRGFPRALGAGTPRAGMLAFPSAGRIANATFAERGRFAVEGIAQTPGLARADAGADEPGRSPA